MSAKTLLLSCVLAGGTPLAACCMVPVSYPGDVDQNKQEVVVFHHNGHEELVLRVAPFFKNAEEAPDTVAWVVTVPSKPTAYATAEGQIFKDAEALYKKLEALAPRSRGHSEGMEGENAASLPKQGLEVSKTIKVGPYEITEVKALGVEALDALNKYLSEHGFPAEDRDHMKYFVENKFTFLCIHIKPDGGKKTFGKIGENLSLPALQIGIDTDRPYYPGKFSSQQGNFALHMTVITSYPLATKALETIKERLNCDTQWENLWTVKPLEGELGKAVKGAKQFKNVDCWYVNGMPSQGFNEREVNEDKLGGAPVETRAEVDRALERFASVENVLSAAEKTLIKTYTRPQISTWDADIFFDLGGDKDVMPSKMYEGDGKRPALKALPVKPNKKSDDKKDDKKNEPAQPADKRDARKDE